MMEAQQITIERMAELGHGSLTPLADLVSLKVKPNSKLLGKFASAILPEEIDTLITCAAIAVIAGASFWPKKLYAVAKLQVGTQPGGNRCHAEGL